MISFQNIFPQANFRWKQNSCELEYSKTISYQISRFPQLSVKLYSGTTARHFIPDLNMYSGTIKFGALSQTIYNSKERDTFHPPQELQQLSLPFSFDGQWSIFHKWFFEQIPKFLDTAIGNFDSKSQFVLLWLAGYSPRAIQLLESGDYALYFLAAFHLYNNQRDEIERGTLDLKDFFGQKKKSILAACGFPESESVVKILRKFIIEKHITPSNLQIIRGSIKDDSKLNLLRHLNYFDANVIQIFADHSYDLTRYLNVNVINEAAGSAFSVSRFDECITLQEKFWGKPAKKFNSLNELYKFCEEINYKAYVFDEVPELKNGKLPPPPIVGNKEIVPLRDVKSVITHAEEMNLCLIDLLPMVALGDMYFYEIKENEDRAVVGIIKNPQSKKYKVYEIRKTNNERVSEQTTSTVEGWLAAVQG